MTGLLKILSVAALTLVLASCDLRTPSAGNDYSAPTGFSRYGSEANNAQTDESAEEARGAKEGFQDAASELRSAVQALSFTPWRDQMHIIRSRLEDADEALARLERLRGSDHEVLSARDEVDNMRSHMDRLYYENWRTIRPDMGVTSSLIEDDALSIRDVEEE